MSGDRNFNGWDDYVEACKEIQRLRDEIASSKFEDDALAIILWKRYYKQQSPDFQLLGRVSGVISQIDNMIAGILEQLQEKKNELKRQCSECPLNRRIDDSTEPAFLRRQAD